MVVGVMAQYSGGGEHSTGRWVTRCNVVMILTNIKLTIYSKLVDYNSLAQK